LGVLELFQQLTGCDSWLRVSGLRAKVCQRDYGNFVDDRVCNPLNIGKHPGHKAGLVLINKPHDLEAKELHF
jgi:hypothetical protein